MWHKGVRWHHAESDILKETPETSWRWTNGQSPLKQPVKCRTTIHRREADPYNGLRIKKKWCSWPDIHCICRWHDWCYPRGVPTRTAALEGEMAEWQRNSHGYTGYPQLNQCYSSSWCIQCIERICLHARIHCHSRAFFQYNEASQILSATYHDHTATFWFRIVEHIPWEKIKTDQVMGIFSRKKKRNWALIFNAD